jgi:hypothetical protein
MEANMKKVLTAVIAMMMPMMMSNLSSTDAMMKAVKVIDVYKNGHLQKTIVVKRNVTMKKHMHFKKHVKHHKNHVWMKKMVRKNGQTVVVRRLG